MGFKRENSLMFLLALLAVVSSMGLGWALSRESFHLSIIFLALLTIMVSLLYRRLTKTNREILFFFKALKNDDSSISYAARRSNRLIDELNGYLNELNLSFKEMKIKHELREHFFNRILENLSGGLMVVAKTGHVNHINQQALLLFDLPALTHLKALRSVNSKLYRLMEGLMPGSKSEFRLQYRDTGVKKTLGLQCTAINLRGEDVRIITIQDLSHEMEQKEIDDWIRLIRVMSHEIMNSLAPITSISTTLKALWKEEGQQDHSGSKRGDQSKRGDLSNRVDQTIRGLDAIAEQSEGLTTFFESYRVLSRIPDPHKKEFSICSMFDKLELLTLNMHDNSGISFSFTCIDPELKLKADEQMVTQVMLNLIKNASQALEGVKEAKIEIQAASSQEIVQISVTDNGPGIPVDIRDDIFLPFFTTRQKGTGVGLSYSRQVMKLNGGNIDFESEPGRTSFRLSWSLKKTI